MKKENNELPSHLKKIDIDDFEVCRKKQGKGFRFISVKNNKPLRDKGTLDYVKSIGVPATWTEVKLCLDPNAYIKAWGYDGSGKLQYLYHQDYLNFRNQKKFTELYEFGLKLPRMRRLIRKHLKGDEWNKQKLMALMVRILDKYHLRVGSRIYARKNKSFGLTTLRKKHVHEEESNISFEFSGKSEVMHSIKLDDPVMVKHIREIAEFPGWELFSIKNGKNNIQVNSSDINAYIREISDSDFTARSFRTWAGTVLAVKNINKAKKIVAKSSRRELLSVLTEIVAAKLGNTPAICRSYYIHPVVLEKVAQEDFDPTPCDPVFMKNNLYRNHECRTLEILSN